MINPIYKLFYIENFKNNRFQDRYEWSIEKKVNQVVRREILAILEIDRGQKTFSFNLFEADTHRIFLPRLMGCVTRILLNRCFTNETKLSMSGLEEFIRISGLNTEISKELLLEWLKNGGDPHAVCFAAESKPVSLIFASVLVEGMELFESFLEHSADPNDVLFTDSKGKIIRGTLAHFAALYNRLDIMEGLVSRKFPVNTMVVNSDPNLPPSTPLRIAVSKTSLPLAKLILENTPPPNQSELSELLRLAIDAHSPEIIQLLLKSRGIAVSLQFAQDFIDHIDVRKMLGHRFGIAIDEFDTGLGFSVRIPTEGKRPYVEREFQSSIEAFFGNNSPIFNLLFAKTPPPAELIKLFHTGLPIFLKGDWTIHFTRLALVKNLLCVFNRGGLRERGSQPGIQIYLFENPELLEERHLLKLQKSPNLLLHPESRKSMGLREERFATLIDDAQPGGFCFWNNSKGCIPFILALSTIPEHFEGYPKEFLLQLEKGLHTTNSLYKAWSRFDRERGILNALDFYEAHPEIKPDIPFLLFISANNKSQNPEILKKFSYFITSEELKYEDFLVCDNAGKNLLHHLSNETNLNELEILAEGHIESIFKTLANSPDKLGRFPLDIAIEKGKWEIAAELLAGEAFLPEKLREKIYEAIFSNDSIALFQTFEKAEVIFGERDSSGLTALHSAIRHNAKRCIAYILNNKRGQFITSSKDLKEYMDFALRAEQPKLALYFYTFHDKLEANLSTSSNLC